MANIDINNDENLSAEDLEQVKGGLLPAVQKVREAAAVTTPPKGEMHIRKALGRND